MKQKLRTCNICNTEYEIGFFGCGAKYCGRACAKEARWVVADVYEKLLADHLDDLLDVPRYSPDAEIFGVHTIPNLTVKIALDQLRKKELDKETEAVYTKAIENYYEYLVESGKL